MDVRPWTLILIMASLALAGCADEPAGETATPTTQPTGTTDPRPVTAPDGGIDAFSASATNGVAPLPVTFSLDASSEDDGATWRLAFGDGNDEAGNVQDLPADVEHTYEVAGSYRAVFGISFGDNGSAEQVIQIEVTLAEPSDPPQQTFEFDHAVGGCLFGNNPQDTCVSYELGPEGEVVDGFWHPVDERYYGMTLTTFASLGGTEATDTDCWVDDKDFNRIGDGSNGGDQCAITIPNDAAWVFFGPWVEAIDYARFDFA